MTDKRDPQAPPWVAGSDQPRTVLVFLIEALWAPHHATGLEIARNHRDAGDKVHIVACPTSLASCAVNPFHRRYTCTLCRGSLQRGIKTLGLPSDQIHELPLNTGERGAERVTGDLVELRQDVVEGLPLGRGAASSLVSALRESDPAIAEHASLVQSLLDAAHLVAGETERLLDRLEPDLVYVFNGRYAESQPIVALCVRRGIQLWSHDLGYEADTFRLVPNDSVHNLAFAKGLVRDLWALASGDETERARVAASFFDGRRYGGTGDAVARYRFAIHQQRGALPPELHDPDLQHRVGIFVSSEDEMAVVDDYQNPVYRDQLEALDAIVSHPWPRTTRLFVRSHPNLRGLHNTQTRLLDRATSLPQVTVIPPDSPVDTYRLIEECDVVVTFGSTVGIEAAYWGTPSVLIGRAEWEDLGVYRPATHGDVIKQITSPGPQGANALPFGFMQRSWGLPFEQYAPWPEGNDRTERIHVVPARSVRVRSRVQRFLDPSGGIAGRIAGSARGRREGVMPRGTRPPT